MNKQPERMRKAELINEINDLRATLEKKNKQLENESKFRKLYKTQQSLYSEIENISKIGIWKVILPDRAEWSNVLYEIFEIDKEKTKLTFDSFIEFIHPSDRTDTKKALETAIKKKTPLEITHRIVTPNNKIKILHVRGKVIFNKSGHPVEVIGSTQDITGIKKIETAKWESEEKFISTFNATPGAMTITSIDEGKIADANEAFYRLTGFTRKELIGKKTTSLKLWKDANQRKIFVTKLKTNSRIENFEMKVRTKTGDIKWAIMFADVIKFNGKPHILSTAFDISDRKQANERLQQSEKRYQVLANNSAVGIFQTDADGNTTYVNPRWCEISGMKAENAMGDGWLNAVNPEDRKKLSLGWKQATKQKSASSAEYSFLRKDGKIVWVLGQASPELNDEGKIIGYVGTITDITKRKLAEESLHFANLVVENSPVVLFRWKAEEGWPVVFVSENVKQFGYTPEELISGKTTYASIIHLDDLKRVEKEVQSFSASGVNNFRQEYRIIKKDKTFCWTDDRTMIERDEKGKITYYQGIVLDVSYQKTAEEALWESRQMLQLVLDTIPQRIFWKDRNFNYLGCNKTFAKDAGLDSPEEIIGKNDYELSWKETADLYRADDKQIIKNEIEKINFEEPQFRADGTSFWLRTSKIPLRNKEGKVFGVLGNYDDITQRKVAEEAIRESNRKMAILLENLPGMAYRCKNDLDWTMEFVSEGCLRLTGYKSAELIKNRVKSYGSIIHPEDRPVVWRKVQQALREKSHFELEYRIQSKTNETKWVWERGIGIYNKKGDLIALEGFITDITERIEAAKTLSESEKQYKLLFSDNPNPMFVWDRETYKFLDANTAAVNHYGYKKEVFLEMTIMDIRPTEDIPDLKKLVDHDSNKIIKAKGWRHLKKNGELIYVDVTSNSIVFNGRKAEVVVVYDVTEKYKAEKALLESEKKFRSIFLDSHDCIYITSPEGKIIDMNEPGLRLFGFTQDEINKVNAMELYENREDRERFVYEIEKSNYVKDFSVKLHNKKGKIIDCLISSSKRKDDHNNILGYQGIIRDVTKQKEAERNLIKAKNEAERAERIKTEFLAQMSHEIRTPINTLLSFSSLIREEIKSTVNDQLKHYFSFQLNAGKRIIRTIDLILNMSELQTGSFQTNFKKLNLMKIIKDLMNEFTSLAAERELELRLNVPGDKYFVHADEYSVSQIFGNLIDNAIKYTPKGSIVLNVSRKNKTVFVEVKDTGIGMSESYLQQIFEPFSQEEQGYTRKFEGSGLGLALVKKYCDLNNSKIFVDSKKGIGTCFTVSFKLSE